MAAVAPLTHAQYNSPMPLYSKDNVKDVMQQTQDFISHHNRPHSAASGQFNPNQSGAYRLLQETGQIAASHSARLDEQSDEYPHYRGFVDPRVQSPSFKRLQYVTAMDSGPEDDISQELHPPVQSRTDDARSRSATREPSEYNKPQQQQWDEVVAPVRGPRVGERDPTSVDDRDDAVDRSLDPAFADRIAEAERPKVPPRVVPSWARKAEEKREKWQQYGDRYQQRSYEYQPPVATWQSGAGKVQRKWEEMAPSSRSKSAEPGGGRSVPVMVERRQEFAPPAQPSYSPLSLYSRPVNKSPQEYGGAPTPTFATTTTPRPYSSQSAGSSIYQQREYAIAGGGNPGPRYQDYGAPAPAPAPTQAQAPTPRKAVNVSTLVSGEALKPGPHPPPAPVWSKHAEYKRTVWESKRNAVDPDYQQRRTAEEPPPPWAGKAERTHSLWQNEADAWQRQRRQQPTTGMQTRAVSAGLPEHYSGSGSGAGSVPSWRQQRTVQQQQQQSGRYSGGSGSGSVTPSWRQRPVPHEASVGSGGSPVPVPITYQPRPQQQPQWQPAPGGETKSQSSGNYYDPAGNQVSYKKEIYTSSDPAGGGKEYSGVLSELGGGLLGSEDPTLGGPPGSAVSRHVTRKYYKKTTRTTSSTTTSGAGDQQPPPGATSSTTVTTSSYEYPPAGRQVKAGVSEY